MIQRIASLVYCYSEVDGVHREPPVTPIGRDELALKRHRFFADLLSAAQAAADHRVRFNPLGPDFALTDNFGNFVGCLIVLVGVLPFRIGSNTMSSDNDNRNKQ